MLRMKPIANAKRAEKYYAVSDGGYYLGEDALHREWIGKDAVRLGLTGTPEFDQFKNLIHGLHPDTGEQLTALLVDHRIPAWDVTASVPKGVTTALERGDSRIHAAIWAAVREAVAMLEEYATTRVRVDGQQADRVTGGLIAYAVEHPETRPVVDESLPDGHPWRLMPDWDRHIHVVIPNLTFDDVEGKWKAVKFRPIMDIRKYFDRCFDTILAGKLASELGYQVETSWKDGGKFHSWDIKGIPDSVIEKFSRRSKEVGQVEAAIVADMKAAAEATGNPDAPDHLSAVARDKLGATSRQQKREDMTLADYREYWNSRITDDEGRAIAETIQRAMLGQNPRPELSAEQAAERAVDFALRHHSEQESVIRWEELAATAMERSMGAASPGEIKRAAERLGVIFAVRDGKQVCTTEALQAEERYLAGMAAGGRGTVAPLGVSMELERGKLNDGQWETVLGLLESTDRINLVEGPAGAGKSWSLAKLDEAARLEGQEVTYLATTAKAVKVLKKDGFSEAKTVAHFLLDEKMQEVAAGGRVVIDESSMLGHQDAVKLFRIAEKQNLKLIFVGDPFQHGSVPRGSLLKVLKDYGHLRPFKISRIMRQHDPEYRAAAQMLSEGNTLAGFAALDRKEWVREIGDDAARYQAMATEYVQAVADKKDTLVISPTHHEASLITAEIRRQLQAAGKLGTEEREFRKLVNTNATEAERGLATTYRPGDVLVFHQNAKGKITKGSRLTVTDPAAVPVSEASKFSLYRPETLMLAVGDKIRFTGTVKTLDGEHKLRNGDTHAVGEIMLGGNIRLENGWVVAADVGMLRHAFVETSFGAQGQTVRHAILGMSSASLGATNQEQLYVSATRAKDAVSIYTDDKAAVMEAIQRSSQKLAALDLQPEKKPAVRKAGRPNHWLKDYMARLRHAALIDRVRAWQHRATPPERQVGLGY